MNSISLCKKQTKKNRDAISVWKSHVTSIKQKTFTYSQTSVNTLTSVHATLQPAGDELTSAQLKDEFMCSTVPGSRCFCSGSDLSLNYDLSFTLNWVFIPSLSKCTEVKKPMSQLFLEVELDLFTSPPLLSLFLLVPWSLALCYSRFVLNASVTLQLGFSAASDKWANYAAWADLQRKGIPPVVNHGSTQC